MPTSSSRAGAAGCRPLATCGYVIAVGLGAVLAVALVLLVVASLINGIARWNAGAERREAGARWRPSPDAKALENVLVIGEENDKAVGFLAMRVDAAGKQVFGIAIPDGAFIEVPGQGFERVGESYAAGGDVSLAAISNYLTVPFQSYVVVSGAAYRDLLKSQQVGAGRRCDQDDESHHGTAGPALRDTLGDTGRRARRSSRCPSSPSSWATRPTSSRSALRSPTCSRRGGEWTRARQRRSRASSSTTVPGSRASPATRLRSSSAAGFRVVDTKNADRFDYKTTIVVVQRGPVEKGEQVVQTLRHRCREAEANRRGRVRHRRHHRQGLQAHQVASTERN